MIWKLGAVVVIVGLVFMGTAPGNMSPIVAPSRIEDTVEAQAAPLDGNLVIDYQAVDASIIPQTWLDQARLLDTFFAHMSVGNNILDGMADLETQDATRYTIDVAYDNANWFATHNGILHRTLSDNTYPLTKVNTFDDYVRVGGFGIAELAMMKFCPSDVPPFSTTSAADTWIAYRDMMEDLAADYPNVEFIWWTMSLTTAADNRGNDEHAIFNAAVRNYCATNGCVLFDIADIESHDPDGNPVVSATGHEAMWNDYSDDGAHLNATGRVRVAQALWWLLARMAGWNPGIISLSITATHPAASVDVGGTAMYTLTVTASDTLTQPVMLSLEGTPGGATSSFLPASLTPPAASHLVITTTPGVAIGTHPMTVTAAANDISSTARLTLTVFNPHKIYLPIVLKHTP